MKKYYENSFLIKYSLLNHKYQFNRKKNILVLDNLKLGVYNKNLFKKVKLCSPLSLRYIRKHLGFPVRGQRTSSNGKTARKRLWKK